MKRWKVVLVTAAFWALGSFPALATNSQAQGPGVEGKWQQSEDGRQYYVNVDNTRPVSEWKEIQDAWYYFDEEGYMKTGWIEHDGKQYWTNHSGCRVSDITMAIDGFECTFDAFESINRHGD